MATNENTSEEQSAASPVRKLAIGLLATVGAFAIGVVLIVGVVSLFSSDDNGWDNGPFEDNVLDDRFSSDPARPAPSGGGGLFPDEPRGWDEPTPAWTGVPASVEYRFDSRDNSLDLRTTGPCSNDVRYSVTETDQEVQVTAQLDTNTAGCASLDWVTISLDNPIGDRIVVNSVAGLTARPVIR